MNGLRRNLLWVDCGGALVVGALVVVFRDGLARLHHLPSTLILALGLVNLAYGAYSLSLALRRERPLPLLRLLVGANLAWTVCCFVLLGIWRETISPFGVLHLAGEGVYVGLLGLLEWRWREYLLRAPARRASGR